ncbi:ribonuclease Z [Latilactobacillus graminis]|uniref:Ribonuclease Z n=2 Tax=Latilactobacillus graminis TaxID=60519 RepID=A0AA89L4I2_9LACO|nr:ribonuclease Z [Latilactobacillus graminis]KRM23811.1 ribonuclease Z [Latilactobacillus graminis DSM 20719]QFP79702.1 ribonuclease Z [Latilactobacillus graminis]
MELEFLGTGAGVPARQRNVTSIALKLLDERNEVWLFDVGEATQHQILKTTLKPRKVKKIFLTHLHGDHLFGLPGFLSSRSFQGGDEPLTIYGPKGTEEYVRTSLKISESHLTYALHFVTLPEEGVVLDDGTFHVECAKLDHRIASYGFRIVEKDHPGELQVEKLHAAGIPAGPVYAKIKNGEVVTLADGRQIDGKDYIGHAQKGRIVTIIGDTRQCPPIERLAMNADVLVHEGTFGKQEQKIAHQYFHSTNINAAKVAKAAHVKRLLLTHISARYLGQAVRELQNDARNIFKNTKVVSDLDIYDIPFHGRKD